MLEDFVKWWGAAFIAGDFANLASAFLAIPLWAQGVKIASHDRSAITSELTEAKPLSRALKFIVKFELFLLFYSIIIGILFVFFIRASNPTYVIFVFVLSIFTMLLQLKYVDRVIDRISLAYITSFLFTIRNVAKRLQKFIQPRSRMLFFIGIILLIASTITSRIAAAITP